MIYHPILTIAGLFIIGLVVIDATITTLLLSGAGPISGPLSRSVGRLAMRSRGAIAKNASIIALIVTFLVWTALLLIGWTLVFCGEKTAILSNDTRIPADFLSRFYYAGFTITTLGTGNYVPNGGLWQVLSIIAAANGFFLVTISATYIFSVLTALNERRAIGASVGHLGSSPEEMATLASQSGLSHLSSELQEISTRLQTASIKRDTYPVIEYTHVVDDQHSFAVAVAQLGELVILFEEMIDPSCSPPPAVLKPLRRAVHFLMNETDLSGADQEPPLPDASRLSKSDLPLQQDWKKRMASREVKDERKRLAAWLAWHHRNREATRPETDS